MKKFYHLFYLKLFLWLWFFEPFVFWEHLCATVLKLFQNRSCFLFQVQRKCDPDVQQPVVPRSLRQLRCSPSTNRNTCPLPHDSLLPDTPISGYQTRRCSTSRRRRGTASTTTTGASTPATVCSSHHGGTERTADNGSCAGG